MKRINVLLAEDHRIVREGLRALLQMEADMEIVGEAENGQQAVLLANQLVPDVVVMDLAMPLLNGLDAISRIRETTPASTRVLVLSSYDDESYIQQARALGASGYLVKKCAAQVLGTVIRIIYGGGLYFKPINSTPIQTP
jgi:DNA-binding NarL/FixJ family response regulator